MTSNTSRQDDLGASHTHLAPPEAQLAELDAASKQRTRGNLVYGLLPPWVVTIAGVITVVGAVAEIGDGLTTWTPREWLLRAIAAVVIGGVYGYGSYGWAVRARCAYKEYIARRLALLARLQQR